MARIDWMGRWFETLERAGEDLTIRFGQVGGDTPVWHRVDHTISDGVDGFAGLLEAAGVRAITRVAPRAVDCDDGWRAIERYGRTRKRPSRWIASLDRDWPRGARRRPRTSAWRVLDVTATDRLIAAARAAGGSITTIALIALQRALDPDCTGDASACWVLPVDLRRDGALRPRGNRISSIWIMVRDGDDPRSLLRRMVRKLEAGEHLGALRSLELAGDLAGDAALAIGDAWWARRDPPETVGLFSNLGAWRGDGDPGARWLFVPPVTYQQPFAAGLLTWNGALGLGLTAHPALQVGAATVEAWLDRWVARLSNPSATGTP